jgi:hypothetical protein
MKSIGNTIALLAITFAGLTTTRAQDPLPSRSHPNELATPFLFSDYRGTLERFPQSELQTTKPMR